ncbi:hypothetical protein SAMN02745866_03052 [Alteromonadaceae bacterium Bs31]|nr:hypothetical protein SAMN02745866_03052 [Alteromonadaceae bacterium Bs31]
MKAKSSAHYQREYRQRLRDMGLVKKEVWILPENAKLLANIEKQLRYINPKPIMDTGDKPMTTINLPRWSSESLCEELKKEELFTSGNADIELIDGVEPTLHIIMREYGDLPLFLTAAGEQIVVEAVLWPTGDVEDPNKFNDAVLRTHKYFPLSTISLDTLSDGKSYYMMFGALSATSVIPNILFEIETLAANVIHATEAYSNLLTTPLDARA